jgi:hypothetical protein
MVPICCPETSVGNYHCSLRTNPEDRSYLLFAVVCVALLHIQGIPCWKCAAIVMVVFTVFLQWEQW